MKPSLNTETYPEVISQTNPHTDLRIRGPPLRRRNHEFTPILPRMTDVHVDTVEPRHNHNLRHHHLLRVAHVLTEGVTWRTLAPLTRLSCPLSAPLLRVATCSRVSEQRQLHSTLASILTKAVSTLAPTGKIMFAERSGSASVPGPGLERERAKNLQGLETDS